MAKPNQALKRALDIYGRGDVLAAVKRLRGLLDISLKEAVDLIHVYAEAKKRGEQDAALNARQSRSEQQEQEERRRASPNCLSSTW
jgi:topoisomerase IA-like protein